MKLKHSIGKKSKVKLRRKTIVIGLVAIIVLVIAGYVLWSKQSWDAYEKNYQATHVNLKDKLSKAVGLSVTNEQDRQNKLVTLDRVAEDVALLKDTTCTINVLVAWQRGPIKAFDEREEACKRMVSAVLPLGDKIRTVTQYLRNEEALAKVVKSAQNTKSELAEADWQSQADAWHKTIELVAASPSTSEFAPIKLIAGESLKSINDAWQSLLAAHGAKDKIKFLEAQGRLGEAYASLENVTVASTKQLKTLLDALQAAYSAAFV